MSSMWVRKSFCVITGASRGIGRQIAVRMAGKVSPGSVFLLLARDGKKLSETKQLVKQFNPAVEVIAKSCDLSNKTTPFFYDMLMNEFHSNELRPEEFEMALIVHNAASMYDTTKKTTEMEDSNSMREYFDTNIISTVALNTAFLKIFPSAEKSKSERVIVNLSSKCGLTPVKSLGMYCTGKAARDMFFRVMAEEDKSLVILTYNPGHVDTDMTSYVTETISDPTMKQVFNAFQMQVFGMVMYDNNDPREETNLNEQNKLSDRKEHGKLLTADQTATCMLNILERRNFKSGQHVRFDHQ